MDKVLTRRNGTGLLIEFIGSNKIRHNFVDQMDVNNTFCPEIDRVIYNIGTKQYFKTNEKGKRVRDENGKFIKLPPVKVLSTVVYFQDGTKVVVTNSQTDGVTFVEQHVDPKDNTSPKVTVATESSKEAGLVYAIVKRLAGQVEKNGTVNGDGFGRKLRDVLTNKSYDTTLETAKTKYTDAKNKKAHEAKKGTSTRKATRKPSIKNALALLEQFLEKQLEDKVSEGTTETK